MVRVAQTIGRSSDLGHDVSNTVVAHTQLCPPTSDSAIGIPAGAGPLRTRQCIDKSIRVVYHRNIALAQTNCMAYVSVWVRCIVCLYSCRRRTCDIRFVRCPFIEPLPLFATCPIKVCPPMAGERVEHLATHPMQHIERSRIVLAWRQDNTVAKPRGARHFFGQVCVCVCGCGLAMAALRLNSTQSPIALRVAKP